MTRKEPTSHRRARLLLGAGVGLLVLLIVPRWWCGRPATPLWRGDTSAQLALAIGMEDWIGGALAETDYHTGSTRYDGEWLFGTYMMSGMGFGQVALQHPTVRDRMLASMETAIERLLVADLHRFDTEAWGEDALDTLDGDQGHAAYLGYLDLLLSLHRFLEPDSRYAALNDDISDALAARVASSPTLLAESYPGEVYPIDNCAGMAGMLLRDRITGEERGDLFDRWKERLLEHYRDPESRLLIQAVHPRTGEAADLPRGSGTAMCAWFVSFVDRDLSRTLHRAVVDQGEPSPLGFSALREYPRGMRGGLGDIDSGPVIFALGVSVTGMSIGNARVHRDEGLYKRLYRTAHLFGAPVDTDDGRHFATGGPIGDAMMFAFLTALPGGLDPEIEEDAP